MTKLQKQLIIKPFIVIFTILYIFALFRFEFIKYITIIVSFIFIVLVLGYFIIKDYKIRGMLAAKIAISAVQKITGSIANLLSL